MIRYFKHPFLLLFHQHNTLLSNRFNSIPYIEDRKITFFQKKSKFRPQTSRRTQSTKVPISRRNPVPQLSTSPSAQHIENDSRRFFTFTHSYAHTHTHTHTHITRAHAWGGIKGTITEWCASRALCGNQEAIITNICLRLTIVS